MKYLLNENEYQRLKGAAIENDDAIIRIRSLHEAEIKRIREELQKTVLQNKVYSTILYKNIKGMPLADVLNSAGVVYKLNEKTEEFIVEVLKISEPITDYSWRNKYTSAARFDFETEDDFQRMKYRK